LFSQIKRIINSIAANLAEVTSRITNKDKAHFTAIAFSTTMEVFKYLLLSKELSFVCEEEYQKLKENVYKI
jgi:four helix bundle protein